MGEVKRVMKPIEVNYVCDKCDHGMMKKSGEMDQETGDIQRFAVARISATSLRRGPA